MRYIRSTHYLEHHCLLPWSDGQGNICDVWLPFKIIFKMDRVDQKSNSVILLRWRKIVWCVRNRLVKRKWEFSCNLPLSQNTSPLLHGLIQLQECISLEPYCFEMQRGRRVVIVHQQLAEELLEILIVSLHFLRCEILTLRVKWACELITAVPLKVE